MYCPNCGTLNAETNRFCLKCGTALSQPQPAVPLPQIDRPSAPAVVTPTAPAVSKGRRRSIGVFLAALVLLSIGAVIVVLIKNNAGFQSARPIEPGLTIARANETGIVLMTANGSQTIPLSDTLKPIELAISPDGSRVAFVAAGDQGYTLNTVNVDGTALTQIVQRPGEVLSGPAWSPDNRRLAFVIGSNGNADIYAINVDGSGLTRLTDQPTIDAAPAWSPDGTRLAFYSDRTGTPEIYVMKADGSDLKPVTSDGKVNVDPAWSPDGARLAFASQRDGNFEIYTQIVDGTDPTRLTNSPEDERHPAWSPDGSTIAYVSGSHVMLMNSDGSAAAQVASNTETDTRSFVSWLATSNAAPTAQLSPLATPSSLAQTSPLATLPPTNIATPSPAITASHTSAASSRILLPLIMRALPPECRDSSPYQLSQDQLAQLGCPGQGFITSRKIILQRFQNGVMVIFAKPNNTFDNKGGGFIYVLANDGRAWRAVDTFVERSSNRSSWYACQSKSSNGPETTGVPWRGFGKAWCEHTAVREALGRAQSAELTGSTASFQSYDLGRAFQISDWRGIPGWNRRDIVVVTFPSVEDDFLSGQWIRK